MRLTLFQEIPSFLSVVKIMQRHSYTMILLILVIRFYQTVIYKPFPKSITAFDDNIFMHVWLSEPSNSPNFLSPNYLVNGFSVVFEFQFNKVSANNNTDLFKQCKTETSINLIYWCVICECFFSYILWISKNGSKNRIALAKMNYY
jgi:hypothetical protein